MNTLRGKNVLICGGSGLVGTGLKNFLKHRGYRVKQLSQNPKLNGNEDVFHWNPVKGYLDERAVLWADYIINLAGTGIADKRWTHERKSQIACSRIQCSDLLVKALASVHHHVKTVISASAIGFYDSMQTKVVSESDNPGTDFLARTCIKWEVANNRFGKMKVRNVILRIGIVLSVRGGVLKEMLRSFRFLFMGVVFGNGKQICSWIHIDDICRIMLKAMEDEKISGVYNAVAPIPVSNSALIQAISENKKGYHPIIHIPPVLLKLLLGERAVLILNSQHVSSEKILSEGFQFHFPDIKSALKNLIENGK